MPDAVPYSRYAAVYEQSGQSGFSLRIWPHVRRRLRRHGLESGRALELCCGTGAAAEVLANDGFRVVAVDLSREMLLAGRGGGDSSLPRCQADARALPLADGAFDLVTSFYDSLNYLLTLADLETAIAGVGRVLRPGGWFVFDLNTESSLRELWTGVCHAEAGEGVSTIWIGQWLPAHRISRLTATFFVRGEDGRYDRFEEVHDERGFSDAELTAILSRAGLRCERVEDARNGQRPGPSSRRLLYFARREAARQAR